MLRLLIALLCSVSAYAASCASVTTGNWSSQTTWGAAGTGCSGATDGIPGAGDTVTIANTHTVTVTDAKTIGTDANGVVAVTIDTSGLLDINGGTLSLRGDVVINGTGTNSDAIYLRGGGTLQFDPNTGNTHAILTGSSVMFRTLHFQGTSVQHVTFKTTTRGGNNGYVGIGATFTYGWNINWSYVDATNIGDSSRLAFLAGGNNALGSWDVQNSTFTGCGRIGWLTTAAATVVRHKYNTHASTAATNIGGFDPGAVAMVGGAREVVGNVFDKPFGLRYDGATGAAKDFTFTDNYFNEGFSFLVSSATNKLALYARNFVRRSTNGATFVGVVDNTYVDNWGVLDFDSNNVHYADLGCGQNNVIVGWVLDSVGGGIGGNDGLLTASGCTPTVGGGLTTTVTNSLVLPNPLGDGGTALTDTFGSKTDYTIIAANNTVQIHNSIGAHESSAGTGAGNQIYTIKDEIIYGTNNSGSSILYDVSAVPITDKFGPFLNNWKFNINVTPTGACATMSNGGNGYCVASSSPVGGTDTTGNPRFVDGTRNLVTFPSKYLQPKGFINPTVTVWTGVAGGNYNVGDFVSETNPSWYGGATIWYRAIATHAKGTANSEPSVGSAWRTYWEYAGFYFLRDAISNQRTITDNLLGVSNGTYYQALLAWVRVGFRPQEPKAWKSSSTGSWVGAVSPVPLKNAAAAAGAL